MKKIIFSTLALILAISCGKELSNSALTASSVSNAEGDPSIVFDPTSYCYDGVGYHVFMTALNMKGDSLVATFSSASQGDIVSQTLASPSSDSQTYLIRQNTPVNSGVSLRVNWYDNEDAGNSQFTTPIIDQKCSVKTPNYVLEFDTAYACYDGTNYNARFIIYGGIPTDSIYGGITSIGQSGKEIFLGQPKSIIDTFTYSIPSDITTGVSPYASVIRQDNQWGEIMSIHNSSKITKSCGNGLNKVKIIKLIAPKVKNKINTLRP